MMGLNLREERIDELTTLIAVRMPPRKLEITATEETLPGEAMEIARVYQRANPDQRAAFDALVKAFEK